MIAFALQDLLEIIFPVRTEGKFLPYARGGCSSSDIVFTLIGISLFASSKDVQFPLLKGQYGRREVILRAMKK